MEDAAGKSAVLKAALKQAWESMQKEIERQHGPTTEDLMIQLQAVFYCGAERMAALIADTAADVLARLLGIERG